MIQRPLLEILFQRLKQSPAVALHGARQTGKTTLARQVCEKRDGVYFDRDWYQAEIYAMFYDLYGLTPDEIKIVEGSAQR